MPSPAALPDPGIEPESPALQADSLPMDPPGQPRSYLQMFCCSVLFWCMCPLCFCIAIKKLKYLF